MLYAVRHVSRKALILLSPNLPRKQRAMIRIILVTPYSIILEIASDCSDSSLEVA